MPADTPQPSVFETLEPAAIDAQVPSSLAKTDDEFTAEIIAVSASGDLATVVEALGNIARARGMSQVAREAGLARESLYRALHSGGNPEFSTVMKVMSSMGLRCMSERRNKKRGPADMQGLPSDC
jgi:probable addiction module antidote protein